MPQKILILDFGSQYTQLIARRVRELNVYCEIFPFNKIPAIDDSIKGIILSGSPYSINEENAPNLDLSKLPEDIPLLGVCYGAQLLAYSKNGRVESASNREYGRANLQNIVTENPLLKGVEENSQVWMSHGDTITELPEEFQLIASTEAVPVAAFQQKEKMVFGLQFHPEVTHSEQGLQVLKNFIVDICHCDQGWTPESFVESSVNTLKRDLGDDHVIMALSGGVDSTVAAILLHKAIGSRLHCVFVDHGLLRKDEYAQVLESYKNMGLNIKGVDASELFLGRLEGVSDPEQKRKIIGASFIDVFDQHAKEVEAQGIQAKWLGQGTIYPDIIESVSVNGPSVAIKSHHNVGGLPDFMKLKVVEPLKALFKDEVRKVGSALEIDPNILNRHPFPGPGLAIRILGEITREKVQILQHAD